MISTNKELQHLIQIVDKARICAGHPDDRFIKMLEKRKTKAINHTDESVAATIDVNLPVVLNGMTYTRTVRTQSCDILVARSKCTSCVKYRPVLRALFTKESKKTEEVYLCT